MTISATSTCNIVADDLVEALLSGPHSLKLSWYTEKKRSSQHLGGNVRAFRDVIWQRWRVCDQKYYHPHHGGNNTVHSAWISISVKVRAAGNVRSVALLYVMAGMSSSPKKGGHMRYKREFRYLCSLLNSGRPQLREVSSVVTQITITCECHFPHVCWRLSRRVW
jgi:hypothetical protein